jgi:uncharacterized lipoprotein YddW (UPF0748 family)
VAAGCSREVTFTLDPVGETSADTGVISVNRDAGYPDATDPQADAGDTPPQADAGAPSDTGADPDVVTPPDPDATSTADVAPTPDAAPDTTDFDGSGEPAPEAELVTVSHAREFRGIWVATVSNINFPSARGLSAAQLRAELDGLVRVSADTGMNAIVFQVRPEGDAVYDSDIEPWSRYLTGTQGQDPGVDPLAYLIEAAHARSIEVHAWLNPYRARSSSSATVAAGHMAAVWPQYAYTYRNQTWMDPGAAPVQDRLVAVIDDLITRYDLDGIHFDDYFYPYPDGPFPDSTTYNAYRSGGGSLSLNDWRRDNVNRMVQRVHTLIAAEAPDVRFGISPFGIYRPGQPAGITGLDQYDAIFADPVRWADEEWVDYLAPQLYWPTTQTAQAYEKLLRWWTEVNPRLYIFAGNYLSKIGENEFWTLSEFREQLRLSRAYRSGNSMGNIWFQIAPLQRNSAGAATTFASEFYATPAATPPLVSATSATLGPPIIQRDGDTLLLTAPATPAGIRAWAVYLPTAPDTWTLDTLLPADTTRWTPTSPDLVLSVIDRRGVESVGVRVR